MQTVAVVPTRNEAANIGRLLDELLSLPIPDFSVLVIDDHSPDGTAALAAARASDADRVHVLERMRDRGRGSAGITGFYFALARGADAIIEMDADFQHPPTLIPSLLDALGRGADIAIASRLAPGAQDERAGSRRGITALANAYARTWLARPAHLSRVRDWTTGFRAYRREVFARVPCHTLASPGPSLLQEILFRALEAGLRATEIPFAMPDRVAGESTFNRRIAVQSLLSIPAYRFAYGPFLRAHPPFRPDRYRIERVGPHHDRLT